MMKQQIRKHGRRLAERVAPTVMASLSDVALIRRDVGALRRRVKVLESEVQETRRLSRRVAELTDIVQELLVPAANRDEAHLRELLEKYGDGLR